MVAAALDEGGKLLYLIHADAVGLGIGPEISQRIAEGLGVAAEDYLVLGLRTGVGTGPVLAAV